LGSNARVFPTQPTLISSASKTFFPIPHPEERDYSPLPPFLNYLFLPNPPALQGLVPLLNQEFKDKAFEGGWVGIETPDNIREGLNKELREV
jgi:hypothetical protein